MKKNKKKLLNSDQIEVCFIFRQFDDDYEKSYGNQKCPKSSYKLQLGTRCFVDKKKTLKNFFKCFSSILSEIISEDQNPKEVRKYIDELVKDKELRIN